MTLTELEALAEDAVIPFGQAMDGKRFTDAMVKVNRFQMEANPQTIKALIALCRMQHKVLVEFDALIEHQYTGTREAMSDLTYAAQDAAKALAAFDAFEKGEG